MASIPVESPVLAESFEPDCPWAGSRAGGLGQFAWLTPWPAFGILTNRFRTVAVLAALSALVLGAAPPAFGTTTEAPSFKASTSPSNAPPGILISIQPDWYFDNAGTDPEITDAVFSTTEYYSTYSIGANGFLFVQTKTNAELSALSPPPPNPFEVTVDLTMENAEGQTASGTLTLQTTYERTSSPPDDAGTTPTLSQTEDINAPPGATLTITVVDLFDNAGAKPVFDGVGWHNTAYLGIGTGLPISGQADKLTVIVLTNAELNALASPPEDNPFKFKADVTVSNDEGQTASGTITFSTTWIRDDTGLAPPSNDPLVSEPSEGD